MKLKSILLTAVAILGLTAATMAQVTVTISANGPTTFCNSGTAQLSSTITPAGIYQYQWIKDGLNIIGANSANYNATSTGIYYLKATSLSNISYNSNTISISVNPLPSTPLLTYNSPAIICNGSSITLSDNSSSNVNYQWYLNNNPINNATSNSCTANVGGNYKLIITNVSTNCTSQAQVAVGEMPYIPNNTIVSCSNSTPIILTDPNFGYSTLPANCSVDISNGNIVNTNIGGNGGGGRNTIICYGGRLTNQGGSNKFVIQYGGTLDFNAGSGSTSVYVKSGGICNIIGSGGGNNIIYYEPGALITPSGLVNSVQCNNIGVIYPTNTTNLCNNNSLTYLWSNGETTPSISVNPTQTTTFSVTVSNGSLSCYDQVTVNPVGSLPTITASNSTIFCQGDSVVLTSSSASGNTWSNGATSQSITVTTSGTYSVSVSYGSCSSTSTPISVIVNPTSNCCTSTNNSISPDGPTTICSGNFVNLTSNVTGATYQWKRNGINITTNGTAKTYKATSTGSYTCVATCNGTALTSNAIAVTSKTNASASVSASGATSFCAGDSVTLNCTNLGSNYSVQWYRTNISMENATAYSQVVKQPGTYKVVTKNLTNGCSRISGSSAIVAVNCRIAGDITSGTPTPLTESEAKFTANELSQGVNIFPNPNNGSFTFAYDGEEYGDAVLQVINSMGQMIYNTNVNVTEGGYTQELQLGENSTKGIYIVRLLINGNSYDSRVLVR